MYSVMRSEVRQRASTDMLAGWPDVLYSDRRWQSSSTLDLTTDSSLRTAGLEKYGSKALRRTL